MSKINIEGVELNEKSIEIIQDWQSEENIGIVLTNDMLDSIAYNLANPDMGLNGDERLKLVSAVLDLKRQMNSFRKEVIDE
jgi:hypothetical protein